MRRPTLFCPLLGTFLLLAAGSAQAALNRWSSGGPFGGPILELELDPADPAIVYAGTFGGVFRSEDHGATWTAASSGLAGAAVSEIEADPDTPGTLYALTDGGIQKSLDRGLSWQPPTLSRFADGLALDPTDPRTLYSSLFGTILKSTNGGASWVLGQDLGSRVSFIQVDPRTPAVYAGTDAGLFRSLDAGSSWQPVWQVTAYFLVSFAIDPADPQILYLGTDDGVFRSTNQGAIWSRRGLFGRTIEDIEIDPSSPSTVLALSHGVYRSGDGGESWIQFIDDRLNNSVALAVDWSSSPAWFVGSSDGVYRSTDEGRFWQSSSTGLTASAVHDLTVDPHRPGILYATLDGDLYKSSDAGATWTELPSISHVNELAFDPKTPSVLYAGTATGVWRSRNAGTTWDQIRAELNVIRLEIDPADPLTIYIGSPTAGIRKSVDGGINWSQAGPDVPGFSAYILAIAPSDPRTLYTAGDPEGLFKSTDGGATWVNVAGGLPSQHLNAVAVDPRDPDVVYAAPFNGLVYKSTDGGATWLPSDAGLSFFNVNGIAIDPSDPSRLYASNEAVGIFRSTNGGASWSLFGEGSIPRLDVEDIVIDPVNPFLLYASSFGGGVLARADLPPGPGSLRLNDGRFLVAMSWATAPGVAGRGHGLALTGDTGYAWFFQEANVEVLLKVLDGCGVTGHFWMFAAGLTNVRTDITVGDLETGAVKIYHNPPGQPFQPIQDTGALPCGAGTSLASESAAAAAGPVLLRGGRFRVTAEFSSAAGVPPLPAQGAALTDDAAYLWFFDPSNVEVFLKVVDGCTVNDSFWIFAAGLTNVEVRITVEDTQTGERKVYENPGGTAFRPIQDTAAFPGCD